MKNMNYALLYNKSQNSSDLWFVSKSLWDTLYVYIVASTTLVTITSYHLDDFTVWVDASDMFWVGWVSAATEDQC